MYVFLRSSFNLVFSSTSQAAIVLPDANLPLALRTILFSALGTAGQRCTSTRRLFLHSSIAPTFLSSLVSAYESVATRLGDPLDPNTLVGPLHAKDGVTRFEKAIIEIQEQGGNILVGGKTKVMEGGLEGGNWVEPTIALFKDATKAEVMRRETFAPSESISLSCCLLFANFSGPPVLFVSTFETLEEAIELNNSVDQGLSSSLFTRFARPMRIFVTLQLTLCFYSDMASAFQWIGPGGSDCGSAQPPSLFVLQARLDALHSSCSSCQRQWVHIRS